MLAADSRKFLRVYGAARAQQIRPEDGARGRMFPSQSRGGDSISGLCAAALCRRPSWWYVYLRETNEMTLYVDFVGYPHRQWTYGWKVYHYIR